MYEHAIHKWIKAAADYRLDEAIDAADRVEVGPLKSCRMMRAMATDYLKRDQDLLRELGKHESLQAQLS